MAGFDDRVPPVGQIGRASGGAHVIQAGGDITIHGPLSADSGPLPPGLGRIPVTSGVFVGREDELARLAASADRTAVVVHGPAGVGKSALVARFAELHADRFAPVWWITANSPDALDAGLAELALALAPHVTGTHGVETSLRWLASHDEWLLVLDDVTDPDHVARRLARTRTGTVVITSRRHDWPDLRTVAVDALPQHDVVELLRRHMRRAWPEADLTGSRALCAALGWQPGAVVQAAAHLAQHHLAPRVHLARLERFPGWTPATSSDSVPRLVADFDASLDHEVRCRIIWELARTGTTAAKEALRSLRPRYDIEQLAINEALEF
ncbi:MULTISPECIES: AAA family ATPase [unclassified Saccharothrix]|uniref:AAA family ATPase n=1 Tax=unclassified Saccharothrix TaxID=2593673 RepID=UPI00307E8B8B